ncbi:T9SS type A sorting domain-containing protein [Hugenholtzia roseola]|uniref:T9SS type A sorting domain-containing protein n=1 Tax=Hugenholtzia roseola TaxID=1002 RepID=UPI001B7F94E5|nr:T9SS type A sorting domain-containing protein [Hugenholtzia roseola]
MSVFGQNCTACDITVSDNSSDLNLAAANQTVCITGNFTFTRGISFNNYATVICIDETVTFNPAYQNGIASTEYNLYGSWNMNNGNICGNCTINNYGTLSNFSAIDGTLNHFSTIPISVTNLNINSNGVLNIGDNSVFNVTGAMTNNNEIILGGTLNVSGSFTNNSDGEIENNGSISVGGAFSNNGDMCSSTCGEVTVGGSFVNNGGAGLGYDTNSNSNCGELSVCVNGGTVNNGVIGNQVTQNCPLLPCPPPTPLALDTLVLQVQQQGEQLYFKWQATQNLPRGGLFLIEESADGQNFKPIFRQPFIDTDQKDCQWHYPNPRFSKAYYRLSFASSLGVKPLSWAWATFYSPSQPPFSLFPNPTEDILKLQFADNTLLLQAFQIEILGAQGRAYRQIKAADLAQVSDNQIVINVGFLPAGLYFLRFQNATQNYILSFIKK